MDNSFSNNVSLFQLEKKPIFTNNVGLMWFLFSKFFLEKITYNYAVLGYFVSFIFFIFQGFCCHYSSINYVINDL